jgi:hypothetical protein
MKKTLLLALAAVATIFTSCSSDITNDNDDSNNGQGKGMTLIANVEQDDTRATFEPNDTYGSTWKFTYTDNDQVQVGNNLIGNYYTFTKSGANFSCADAKATNTDATWYAYYPDTDIDLTNQEGTEASAAKFYALAGATTTATTGAEGLTINMKAQAAVLRIVKVDNYGPCDIYLETADGKFVKGLKAKNNDASFEVVKSETKVSVFQKESTGNAGIYYVIVPAGLKISVYNSGKLIKSTKTAGLTAGKYYTLTSGPTTGTAEATINSETKTINWVQLWIGGPRIATVNVAGHMTWYDARKTGDKYVWGANWRTPTKDEMDFVDKDGFTTKTENVEVDNVIENKDVIAFKYIGVQPGYTNNIMYLPSTDSKSHGGVYWSSTDAGYNDSNEEVGYALNMIVHDKDTHTHYFMSLKKDAPYAVRPVLTKETVLWGEQDIK